MEISARRILDQARASGRLAVDEVQAKSVLAAFGISVPRGIRVIGDASSAPDFAALHFPVVAKIISDDVQHKSDGGFVALDLADPGQARGEIRRMRDAAARTGISVDGFLVEEMAPAGVEVVIGSFRDPTFGPVIMFGLGGIYVEVLRDVSFRICPIERADAADMIEALKFKAVLDGARGGASADRETLIDLLLAIGGADGLLARLGGAIAELDINPIIVNGKSAVAVDALMLLSGEN
jgi:hypothetical protein